MFILAAGPPIEVIVFSWLMTLVFAVFIGSCIGRNIDTDALWKKIIDHGYGRFNSFTGEREFLRVEEVVKSYNAAKAVPPVKPAEVTVQPISTVCGCPEDPCTCRK